MAIDELKNQLEANRRVIDETAIRLELHLEEQLREIALIAQNSVERVLSHCSHEKRLGFKSLRASEADLLQRTQLTPDATDGTSPLITAVQRNS